MNKVFNSVQTHGTKEDCNKFSKSVSYETLVDGTATIGRECGEALEIEGVITRRTSVRRGYLPEQCTHANEESLFASVTCFMRLPRRIQRMLLVMTIPVLTLLLTLITTGESSAEDTAPSIVGRGNCGASCTYTLDSAGTFTIYGEGDMTEYGYSMFGDKYKWNDGNDLSPGHKYGEKIKSIIFAEGSNITSIGRGAFINTTVSDGITIPDSVTKIGGFSLQLSGLTELTIPESVTSIGASAFWGASKLTNINIPESVKYIESTAFRDTPMLSEILIPDTIDTSHWNAQVFDGLSPDTEIVCLGDEEKCKQKLAKYIPKDKGGTCTNYCINKEIQPAQSSAQCNGSYIYENGNCHKRNENQCNDTGDYYYNGATCLYRPRNRQVVCVNPNYKANDGYCDRLRYTPAEAAEVLRDDNTNEVTITFRK